VLLVPVVETIGLLVVGEVVVMLLIFLELAEVLVVLMLELDLAVGGRRLLDILMLRQHREEKIRVLVEVDKVIMVQDTLQELFLDVVVQVLSSSHILHK
jgi:hypothetical protein